MGGNQNMASKRLERFADLKKMFFFIIKRMGWIVCVLFQKNNKHLTLILNNSFVNYVWCWVLIWRIGDGV